VNRKTIRDYSEILEKIKSSSAGLGEWLCVGEISGPIFSHYIEKIILNAGNGKRVLISAGMHGDEPAGVETIYSFLHQKEYLKYSEEWEVTLVPCINPFGYEANTRTNYEGVDLNRKFNTPDPPKEVILAKKLFDTHFDLTIELHEDVDSRGYYLFHSSAVASSPLSVREILKSVQPIMPINLDSEIDGIPANGGVIERVGIDEEMDWWPMAFYSMSKGTRDCLTLETGTQYSMQTRVEAHLTAIEGALNKFDRKAKEE
jgi:protein MpaA